MLSSKANAALMRLKEIEEKYKMKRKEQKWNRKETVDSSISSVSINPSENISAELKETPKKVSKPKLEIKMPDARFEGRTEEMKLSLESEESTPEEMSPKSLEDADKVNLDIAMPLEDKSSRSIGKQDSSILDVTTQENNSIESVLDDSVIPSKSVSHSKISQQNFSTISNKFSGYEEQRKATVKSEKEKDSDKSSEVSREKTPSDLSVTKRSKFSEKSNKISKVHSGLRSRERLIKKEAIIKMPETVNLDQNSKNSNGSVSLRDDSVIEESIGTMEDGSEIISELSRSAGSIAGKTEDSIDIFKNSKHLAAESGYANDTFENISSSSTRSKSESQSEKMINKKKVIDLTGFSTKKIDIAPHKEYRSYLSVSSNKNISVTSESSIVDITKMDEKKSSLVIGMTFDRQENSQENYEKALNKTKESTMIDVIESPMIDDENKIESTKSSLSEDQDEKEDIENEEISNQQIFQNAENVLRKLHRDVIGALAKRHVNSKTIEKMSKSSSESKIEPEVWNVKVTRKVREENERKNHHSAEKDKMFDYDGRERNIKKRKRRATVTNLKSAETSNNTGSRKEDKVLRLDRKQMRGLRKRIVELRLRQEREDLQKYLHELKDLRSDLGSVPSYFSPSKFPKIAEYTQPDSISKSDDQHAVLRERVSAIRLWLKDQYILYHDYCTMAQAINAHYVPTTLDDAKKTIRELRNTTIKIR